MPATIAPTSPPAFSASVPIQKAPSQVPLPTWPVVRPTAWTVGDYFQTLGDATRATNSAVITDFKGVAGETTGDRVADISGGTLRAIFTAPETAGGALSSLMLAPFRSCVAEARNDNPLWQRILGGIGAVVLAPFAVVGAALNVFASYIARYSTSAIGAGVDSLIHRAASPTAQAYHSYADAQEQRDRIVGQIEMQPYIDVTGPAPINE